MELLFTIGFYGMIVMLLLLGALQVLAWLLTLLGVFMDVVSTLTTGRTLDELDL